MASLPPGVVKLNDGEPAPEKTLTLYRDYGHKGPAYGIGAGYSVNLDDLPMKGTNGSTTASKNISSWVNTTDSDAVLIDDKDKRTLKSGDSLEEPAKKNDSVTSIAWN
ncbi:hypothetical protein [Streptomyces sp. CBMA156]|uniref:hypothetical protein n=1 Tax=Streptomyces sp. CBMA156 TaxID=1930280 RepID=UPI001661E763|nr:hypothetical protein [Streptomyces sp. CBMA156]MBD0672632.1 hypothetical protein [Streptomyces sp. CBMA156]